MNSRNARVDSRILALSCALGIVFGYAAFLYPKDACQYEYAVPVETDDGWRTASAADKGMDVEPLVRLLNRLHDTEGHLLHSILIVKDSALVFEAYCDGSDLNLFDENMMRGCVLCMEEKRFTRDELHNTSSVTKSVTSMVFGIAMDRGYISGTDTKMVSFFPDYGRFRTPEKDQITVHHLLSMTSGLPFDERTHPIADSRNDAHRLFLSDDPVAFMLGRDVIHAPGTTYQYSSGSTILLGEILRRTTGQSVPSFAEQHLFRPLGITLYRWAGSRGAPDVSFTPGGLYLRPRDMAKIGQLMLQGGMWNGRRVLSSDWVRRSVTQAIAVEDGGDAHGYGYQWKLGRFGGFDAFYASGWGEQFIVVLPELNLVFVQTSGRYGGEPIPIWYDTILEEHVIPAIGAVAQDDPVRAVVQQWPALLDGGDIEGLLDLFTDDAVFAHPRLPGVVGKDSLRAFVERVFRQQSAAGTSIRVEQIHTSGNWAHVVAEFETTWIPRGGGPPDGERARYLWVLRRSADGAWRVKSFAFYPIT